jgi:hypothetical protein
MTIHLKHILLLAAVVAALQGPGLARAENGQIAPPLGAPSGEQSQGERSQRSRSNARPNDPARAEERRPRPDQQPEVHRSRAEQRAPGREASPMQTQRERLSQPGVNVETPRQNNTLRQQGASRRTDAAPVRPAVMNASQPESRSEGRPRRERSGIQGGDASAQPRHERQRPKQLQDAGQPGSRDATQPRQERSGIQRIHDGGAPAQPRHERQRPEQLQDVGQPRHERQRPEQPRHDAQNVRGSEQRGEDRNRHDRDRYDRKRWEREVRDRRDNGPHDFNRRDRDWPHHWPYRPHHVERVYHHLPPRHNIFHHRSDRYHFYSGRYYRLTPLGFILVRPPVGLVVFSLPIGFRTVISAGFTYYVCGDVYYRRVPVGYEVVQPVRVIDRDYPEQVAVDIDVLNVRYGPDEDEEVIAQVTQGRVLKVLGAAPGWLYIEVEGEDIQGWVMERYVVDVSKGRG